MEKLNFEKAYNMLPAGVQGEARKRIIQGCGWKSRTTFYNKMKGERGINKWEKEEIEKVFKEYSIEIWEDKGQMGAVN